MAGLASIVHIGKADKVGKGKKKSPSRRQSLYDHSPHEVIIDHLDRSLVLHNKRQWGKSDARQTCDAAPRGVGGGALPLDTYGGVPLRPKTFVLKWHPLIRELKLKMVSIFWECMFLDSGNIISDETFCTQSQNYGGKSFEFSAESLCLRQGMVTQGFNIILAYSWCFLPV